MTQTRTTPGESTLGLAQLAARLMTGPLTYNDLLLAPEDGPRYELIDGSLHMSPSPTGRHQLIVSRLIQHFAVMPADLVVIPDQDVILDPGVERRVLRPDLYVVKHAEFVKNKSHALPVAICLLALEIESPSSRLYDRVLKAQMYAEAGVKHYWRVELADTAWGSPVAIVAYELREGTYVETARAGNGQTFAVTAPFALSFDPVQLEV